MIIIEDILTQNAVSYLVSCDVKLKFPHDLENLRFTVQQFSEVIIFLLFFELRQNYISCYLTKLSLQSLILLHSLHIYDESYVMKCVQHFFCAELISKAHILSMNEN